MTTEDIAAVAAQQVRDRVLRVGGYCPFGCSSRCDCAGSLWPLQPAGYGLAPAYALTRGPTEPPPVVRLAARLANETARLSAENSRLTAEAASPRPRAIPVPPVTR